MKLLLERVDSHDTEILTEESSGGEKRLFITGPFLMFGKENKNKRIYPERVMDEAVAQYQRDYIDTRRSLGEIGHPAGRIQIDPERACIMIESLIKSGSYYMGKAKVLSTPSGKLVEALLNDGVKLGVSSRGVGSTLKRGLISEVKNDFRMSTAADVVMDPSAHDAFVQSITEQTEYLLVNGILVEQEAYELEMIKQMKTAKQYQDAVIKKFDGFINSLKFPNT